MLRVGLLSVGLYGERSFPSTQGVFLVRYWSMCKQVFRADYVLDLIRTRSTRKRTRSCAGRSALISWELAEN
jgi:hypothetical protein